MRSLVLIFALSSCSPAPAPAASRTAPTAHPVPSGRPRTQPSAPPKSRRAQLGLSARELPDDITVAEALQLMNDAREREGYDVIRVSQGSQVSQVLGPPADLRSGEEEILVRMYAQQSFAHPGGASFDSWGPETAGRTTDITRGLRRALDTGWRNAPCTLTIAATPDASFFAVVEAATAVLDVRSCPREFSFGLLEESPSQGWSVPRALRIRPSAVERVLELRVPDRPAAPPPQPSVREEREVRVGGTVERWRIQWRDTPSPVCAPEDEWNCPCSPFQYGERGEADLIRSRAGSPDESFPLGAIYKGLDLDMPLRGLNEAALQRWSVEDGDVDWRDQPGFGDRVRARRSATIMELGDYDHDGWATEFVLPVGSVGCAYHGSIVIGISRRQPKLHVFGTAERREEPLVLRPRAWKRLRQSRGRTSVVDFDCGFRGSETQVEIELWTDARGIHGRSAHTTAHGKPGSSSRGPRSEARSASAPLFTPLRGS